MLYEVITLDDALSAGELGPAYDIYNLNLKRRYERYAYALSLLDTPMTFDGDEEYQFDRSKEAWPKDQAELDALWRLKVKAEALSLKLTGKHRITSYNVCYTKLLRW